MAEQMITVPSPACPRCGESSQVRVPRTGFLLWRVGGWLIQEAMPDLSVDDRETLINGFHPACRDEVVQTLDEPYERTEPALVEEDACDADYHARGLGWRHEFFITDGEVEWVPTVWPERRREYDPALVFRSESGA